MSQATSAPEEFGLEFLAKRCAQETERFFRKEPSLDLYCFELLRRAVVLQLQEAWECIHIQYHSLVAGWVQRHSAFSQCDEEVNFFVNGAFARNERWCTPERFVKLGGLAQWLASLKACLHSEIMDYLRQHASGAAVSELKEELAGESSAAPDATVIDAETRALFWQMIKERLQTEHEAVVLEYCFVYGYKARESAVLRPDLFAAAEEVYPVKENLLRRLRRDPALRRFFEETRLAM